MVDRFYNGQSGAAANYSGEGGGGIGGGEGGGGSGKKKWGNKQTNHTFLFISVNKASVCGTVVLNGHIPHSSHSTHSGEM